MAGKSAAQTVVPSVFSMVVQRDGVMVVWLAVKMDVYSAEMMAVKLGDKMVMKLAALMASRKVVQ